MSAQVTIATAAAMRALGAALAAELAPGDVVLLHGDLGAGKTTLTQGLAAALGSERPANSPTFTFVTTHTLPENPGGIARVHHLDLYRLTDPDELEGIGWDAYLADPAAVTIVEWPERAGPWLPDAAWVVAIAYAGPDRRAVVLESRPAGARDRAIATVVVGIVDPE